MRILIINAYPSSKVAQKKFQFFYNTICKIFADFRNVLISKPEFIVKSRNDLSEFIYNPKRPCPEGDLKKNFDSIDMVFIDGDANLLPWTSRARQLGIFFKNCKTANKVVFCAGCGLPFLVYYCATNFREINVINGKEMGTQLAQTDILNFENPKKIEKKDVLLDQITGDIYSYIFGDDLWKTIGNVGMHSIKAAEENVNVGKYFKKPAVFHSKRIDHSNGLLKISYDEVVCYLEKKYLQHWALKKVRPQFVISNKNLWEIHPLNLSSIHIGNYIPLAYSDKCPEIIIHQNTLGLFFNVESKYLDSIQILHNFIEKHVVQIQVHSHLDITLDEGRMREAQTIHSHNTSTIGASSTSNQEYDPCPPNQEQKSTFKRKNYYFINNNNPYIKYTNVFVHSGWTYSKRRGILILKNNACSHSPIRTNLEPWTSTERMDSLKDKLKEIYLRNNPIKIKSNSRNLYSENFSTHTMRRPPSSTTQSQFRSRNYDMRSTINGQKNNSNTYSNPLYVLHSSNVQVKRPKNVTIHKSINSCSNVYKKSKTHDHSVGSSHQTMNLNNSSEYLTPNQTFDTSTMKGKSSYDLQKCQDFHSHQRARSQVSYNKNVFARTIDSVQKTGEPSCNTSQLLDGETIIQDQDDSRERKERKQRKFFCAYYKANPNFIQNYVARDSSESPLLHKFRDENKTKWLNGSFKK